MFGRRFDGFAWHFRNNEPRATATEQVPRNDMHELSIAMSIVEFAEEEAEKRGSPRVTAVHLRLGAFSGVVKSALVSSFEMACLDTRLAGSQLIVEEVPLVVYCSRCDTRRPVDSNLWFTCAECGTPTPEIVQGKELEVTALELV